MNAPVAASAARPDRRTWRAAAVVFLTVFLGGLGLSGATALWAQSGTVAAQVQTGTWVDYTRSGFAMPLTLSVKNAKYAGVGERRIDLSWTNQTAVDPATQKVTYRVEAAETGRLQLRGRSLPYQGPATVVSFETSTPLWPWPAESIRITVTPYVNNVAGTPTVKNLWLDSDGNTWLENAS